MRQLICAKCLKEGYIMNLWGGKWICMNCYTKEKRKYDKKYYEELERDNRDDSRNIM